MAPATTGTASVPRRTTRNISAVCIGYPEHPRIRPSSDLLRRSVVTLELIFPSLDRTPYSSKCSLISPLSRGRRCFLIPKSSRGREGSGLSVWRAGGRITFTMCDLATKTCVPCCGCVPPLKGEELLVLQKQVDEWNIIEEHHITKAFKFPDFRGALRFVNRVGELAEAQGHHPDIFLAWGKVEITTWTHKINGLTESDFILAAKIDQLPKS